MWKKNIGENKLYFYSWINKNHRFINVSILFSNDIIILYDNVINNLNDKIILETKNTGASFEKNKF
jgi:hypothetical protein